MINDNIVSDIDIKGTGTTLEQKAQENNSQDKSMQCSPENLKKLIGYTLSQNIQSTEYSLIMSEHYTRKMARIAKNIFYDI